MYQNILLIETIYNSVKSMLILQQQGVCSINVQSSTPIFQTTFLCLNLGFQKSNSLVYFLKDKLGVYVFSDPKKNILEITIKRWNFGPQGKDFFKKYV